MRKLLSEMWWDDENTGGTAEPVESSDVASPGGDPNGITEEDNAIETTAETESAPVAEQPVEQTEVTAEAGEEDPDAIGEADVKSAERWGVTADEAKSFSSKKDLERFTAVLVRRLAERAVPQSTAQEPPKEQPKPEAKEQAPPAQQASFAIDDYVPTKISAEDYPEIHEELTGFFEHIKTQIEKQVQAVVPRIASSEGNIGGLLQLAMLPQYEKAIASLGPQYEPYLGKGDVLDLDPSSDTFQTHHKIRTMADALSRDCRARGVPLSYKESITTAAKVVLSDKLDEMARKAGDSNGKSRKGATLRKPAKPGRPLAKGDSENARINRIGDLLEAIDESPDGNGAVDRLAIY